MAISVNDSFAYGGKIPADTRNYLSWAEMKAMKDTLIPEVYYAVCKDDGKFYLYNSSNEVDETTGRFRALEGGGAWNGTKAEWESYDKTKLSDGQTVNITDDYDAVNGNIYSTEEVVVGKWIDGKPIYRRVFIGSWSATANTWTTTNISVVGFETLVSASCKRNAKEGNLPIAQVTANSGTSLQITISTGTQTINQIILEYTKTTDV